MSTVIEHEPDMTQAGELVRLDPADVMPWPGLNPRTRFDPERHAELVDSVRRSGGNFQPVVVAPAQEGDVPYWLVVGERRLRACREAGVPLLAIVRQLSYQEALELALIENLDREDLTPLDEARGYQKLIAAGLTQRELAERMGRSQPHVANRLRLLELPDEILSLIEDGILEVSYARDLLLPFARIPEKVRGDLYRAIAKRLREEADRLKGAFGQQQIRVIVRTEAVKRSRPVHPDEALWLGGKMEEAPLFDPELHESCTCQGPRFTYHDAYTNRAGRVRCFDEDWWQKAQAEAKRREQEREDKARAKLAAKAERIGGIPVVDDEDFRKRYKYGTFTIVARGGALLDVDPSALPAEALMIVRDEHSGPEIVCVDQAAAKKAKTAFNREVDRRVEAERARLTAADRAEASRLRESARSAIAGIEPWMLARILIARPMRDDMIVVLRELGHDVKIGTLDSYLEQMPAASLIELFQVLAIRSRAGRLVTSRDPVRKRITREVRAEYAAAVERLMPAPDAPAEVVRELEQRARRLRAALEALAPEPERTRDQAEAVRAAADALEEYIARNRGRIWATPAMQRDLEEAEDVDSWALAEFDDWWKTDPGRRADDEAACITCGCTDSDACDEGCVWLIVDRVAGVGVCSSCAEDEEDARQQLAEWAEEEGVELEVLDAA